MGCGVSEINKRRGEQIIGLREGMPMRSVVVVGYGVFTTLRRANFFGVLGAGARS